MSSDQPAKLQSAPDDMGFQWHNELQLSADARALISRSLSDNSKRGYQSDYRQLAAWGGDFPWTPEKVADYLATHATTHKVATLLRRIATIAKGHRALGLADPTKSEVVASTVRGIRRTYGAPQRQARPISRDDLVAICAKLGATSRDTRDRALLLIGYAAALRRSELVALETTDVEEVRQGLVITLRRSKTDQVGNGRKIAVPFGRTTLCPVIALKAWLTRGAISSGPLFRAFDSTDKPGTTRLSAESVSLIVRSRCRNAGFDPSLYSGHSLRSGLATSAAMAGASSWKIRAQTGHASDTMLARYVRDGELWLGNAAASVL